MLLYVGAVLGVNGIWLIGQARAAQAAPAPVAAGAGEDARRCPRRSAVGASSPPPARAERSPLLIAGPRGRGDQHLHRLRRRGDRGDPAHPGAVQGDLASARGGGFILLFAFTYLWVAFNQFLDAGGHGRSAGTACSSRSRRSRPGSTPCRTRAGTRRRSGWGSTGSPGRILWAVFWALLALERPIARLAGWLAIIEGIVTAWAAGLRGPDRRAGLLIADRLISTTDVGFCGGRSHPPQQLADEVAQRLLVQRWRSTPRPRDAACGGPRGHGRRGRPAPGAGRCGSTRR